MLLSVGVIVLVLVRPLAASARARRRRGGGRLPADAPRCCAAFAPASCPEGGGVNGETCCEAVSSVPRQCTSLRTRAECERARPASDRVCAWLGGRCTTGSYADCAEPPAATPDYYGEIESFEASCSRGSGCDGFRESLERYAEMHETATREPAPVEGIGASQLLVIRDHWRNVGMGFMPSHVAALVLYALGTGLYVYVENYGRYDWTRYFGGHAGLDLRWTPAKQRMWKARFHGAGVTKAVLEVLHEDGSHQGDEDWEEHLSEHLANGTQWLQLNGWATTVNWGRILRPALPSAIKRRRASAAAAVLSRYPLFQPAGPAGALGQGSPSWHCLSCAIWANYRPRALLHRRLLGSPIAASAPLVCLKARTMYACRLRP